MLGDELFQNVMNHSRKTPKKVISIRVATETSDKFDELCRKHHMTKADIYSWALNQAIKKLEAEDG